MRKVYGKGGNGPDVPLDPAVVAWDEQLTDLFHRKADPVSCPLFENNFPCPTTIVSNYQSTDLTGSPAYGILPVVQGAYFDVTEDQYRTGKATFADAAEHAVGPILSGTLPAVAAGIISGAMSNAYQPTNVLIPIDWPLLSNPFSSGTSGGMSLRTIAYGIQITFDGPLNETEGYVEMIQPYEPMYGIPAAGNFDQYRRDRSYSKQYFSSKRTFEFFYSPTCDDIRFTPDQTSSTLPASEISARFALRLGGLKSTDKIQVNFMSIQEWSGHLAIPTQKPRLVTPDSAHVVNALVVGHGALNQRGSPTHSTIAKALKVSTHGHSWLKGITSAAKPLLEDVGAAVTLVKQGAKVWNAVSGMFTA
jgi:hypothetical protein